MEFSTFQPTVPTDLSRRIPVFPALDAPGAKISSVWLFDSPKNNKRFAFKTNLAFMHCVMMEGDTDIVAYEYNAPPRQCDVDGRQCRIDVGAIVQKRGGNQEWRDFRRTKSTEKKSKSKSTTSTLDQDMVARAAQAAGVSYLVKTEHDLVGQEILFDNWITLCAIINRCRGHFDGREAEHFSQRLALQQAVTLGNLLAIPQIDVALMLAVVAMALQRGSIRTNLQSQLIGPMSLLSRVGS